MGLQTDFGVSLSAVKDLKGRVVFGVDVGEDFHGTEWLAGAAP